MRPGGALSPWITVDRSCMPAERLKNTATIIERNIYWERWPISSPIHPTYLKCTLENSGYPVAPKINQFGPITLSNVPAASE